MEEKLTLSVQEVARILGVCEKTVYDLTHTADFPALRIGRRTRISVDGLRKWVRERSGVKS